MNITSKFEADKSEFIHESGFVDIVNNLKATTVNGSAFKANLLEHLKKSPISYGLMNFVVVSAAKVGDQSIVEAFKPVTNKIDENRTTVGLGIAYENIHNTVADKDALESLKSTIVEAMGLPKEELKKSILEGKYNALSNFDPYAKSVIESLRAEAFTQADDSMTKNHRVYNPISVTEQFEDGVSFRIGGKVFNVSKNRISESGVPSQHFAIVSNILESGTYNAIEQSIEFKTAIGVVSVSEACITHNEKMYDKDGFVEMAISEASKRQLSQQQARFIDAVVCVSESFNDIVRVENATVVENLVTGESFALIKANNDTYAVSTVKSGTRRTTTKNYSNVSEAIEELKRLSNFDVTYKYKEEKIHEQKKGEQDAERKQRINESVKEIEKRIDLIDKALKGVDEASVSEMKLKSARELAEAEKQRIIDSI